MMLALRPVTLGVAIALICFTLPSAYTQVQAQLNEGENFRSPPPPPGSPPARSDKGGATRYVTRYVRREVPPGRPPGGRYRGGGTRSIDSQSGCPAVTTPLIALVPFTENYLSGQADKPPITNVWGYTTAAYPTLWFYVPYTNQSLSAKFSIQNDDSPTESYETKVSLPKQPGLIRVQLPKTKPGLQTGKRYRWFLGIDCTPATASSTNRETIYVEGTILRDALKPDLASRLLSASPEQKVALYAENGFWHDALSTLAELRQQRPNDPALLEDWKSLLTGMGTSKGFKPEELAAKPFVD